MGNNKKSQKNSFDRYIPSSNFEHPFEDDRKAWEDIGRDEEIWAVIEIPKNSSGDSAYVRLKKSVELRMNLPQLNLVTKVISWIDVKGKVIEREIPKFWFKTVFQLQGIPYVDSQIQAKAWALLGQLGITKEELPPIEMESNGVYDVLDQCAAAINARIAGGDTCTFKAQVWTNSPRGEDKDGKEIVFSFLNVGYIGEPSKRPNKRGTHS